MKQLSLSTKLYLCITYMIGIAIISWQMGRLDSGNVWMLAILCALAFLTSILRVEGLTNPSHYTSSFLLYSFAFTLYGIPEAILVIVVSSLAGWIWDKSPWYAKMFRICSSILAMQAASFVHYSINPQHSWVSWQAILAIILSMATFDFLNHLIVGIAAWLMRAENFRNSGVFNSFSLILDLTLLYFGAGLALVWIFTPFALVLFLIPIYMIYNTLRVPALKRKTEIDTKTGLFNHEYFMQQVRREINRAKRVDRPLAIIMADLDLLRNINNAYGHLAGDEVLTGIARILRQSIREYDIAARFGGEEFAILLYETTIQQACDRAESIRMAIEEMEFRVPTNVAPIRATMSFGIACRENSSQTTEEIIHNADTALYHSKLSGRNRVYACTNDKYVNFLRPRHENKSHQKPALENPHNQGDAVAESPYKSGANNSMDPAEQDPIGEPSGSPSCRGMLSARHY